MSDSDFVDDDFVPVYTSDESDGEELVHRRVYDLVSEHATKDEALCVMELVGGGVYKHVYDGVGRHTSVYRCASHVNCNNRMRLVFPREEGSIRLEVSGSHASEESNYTKSGISSILKREVDAILVGAGPKKCLQVLLKTYNEKPDFLRLLPTITQLKNRKAYLRRAMEGMCRTNIVFYSIHLDF